MLPAAQLDRNTEPQQLDPAPLLAPADDVEGLGGDGREQLVILAEAEVLHLCALGERDALELDDTPDA